MPVLGYGGLANTNGTRSFTGKAEAVAVSAGIGSHTRRFYSHRRMRPYGIALRPLFALLGVR